MIIDKILDKYYFKKLKNKVQKTIRNTCYIDYVFERSSVIASLVHLKIKKEKYNDKLYKRIYTFDITKAFDDLLNYKEIANEILKKIDEYFEEEE